MTWKMPEGKALRIIATLGEAIRTKSIRNDEAKSLACKLNHYSELVNGRYWRCLVIHLGSEDKDDSEELVIGRQVLACLAWWLLNLRVMLKVGGARIPYPEETLVSTALIINTDAAGGASSKALQGWGLVNTQAKEWARGTWPKFILLKTRHNGAKWGRRLSFLEGFACVLA